MKAAFLIYADFESILKKFRKNNRNNLHQSYNGNHQKYSSCSYGWKFLSIDKTSKSEQKYRGEGAIYNFISEMPEEMMDCWKSYKKHFKKELVMSKGNQRNLTKTNKRHICNKSYSEKDINVKDHCHITGEY